MRNLIYAIVAAILLISLWFFIAPKVAEPTSVAVAETLAPIALSEPAAGDGSADFSWKIQAGNIVGPQQIEIPQGETVVLSFLSDIPDEVHLHGYEHALQLNANTPATFTLVLEHSGRFELESHRLHRVLSVLEVAPR